MNEFEETKIEYDNYPSSWKDDKIIAELQMFLQENWDKRKMLFNDENNSSKQQYLKFEYNALRTQNYIGTIVFNGEVLNIYPKVFRPTLKENLSTKHMMNNLVEWLRFCDNTNFPFINTDSVNTDSDESLIDLLITIYLGYVNKAVSSYPYYSYTDKSNNLGIVRGKINFKDYVNCKIPKGENHRFLCEYSEFEFNNSLNQVIKRVCKILSKTTCGNNNAIVHHILTKMNEVEDVACTPYDCDRIRLNKMQEQRYSIILSLSKMFLMNQTTNYELDNTQSFCFLFPTELLFESFIAGFMKEILGHDAKVKAQYSQEYLIDSILFDGDNEINVFNMRYDIFVKYKNKTLIMDTKYKRIKPFIKQNLKENIANDITQSDLYQILSYAIHEGVEDTYLLYPMDRYEQVQEEHPILKSKTSDGKEIHVHLVRLPFVFEEDIETTKKQLKKTIIGLFDT